jgi:hypothetical protein
MENLPGCFKCHQTLDCATRAGSARVLFDLIERAEAIPESSSIVGSQKLLKPSPPNAEIQSVFLDSLVICKMQCHLDTTELLCKLMDGDQLVVKNISARRDANFAIAPENQRNQGSTTIPIFAKESDHV